MINSIISEKIELCNNITNLMKENTDLYDCYASANEDLFNMVDTELLKLHYKVMRFKND